MYNLYVELIFDTFYNLLSLQSWFFAINYLESAESSSLTKTYCTKKCIKIVSYSVALIYTVIEISCLLFEMITFPGWLNDGTFDEYFNWEQGKYNKSNNIWLYSWLILNIVSTLVAVIAIRKIF